MSPKASPSEDVPKKKKGKKAKAEEEEEEEEETETGEKFTVVVKALPWKVNSLLVLSFEHLDRCLGSFLSLLFSSAYLFLLCNSTCYVIVVRFQYALVLCLSFFLRYALISKLHSSCTKFIISIRIIHVPRRMKKFDGIPNH